MNGHVVDCCFFHEFSPEHRYHGKDAKSKGKKLTSFSTISIVEIKETKQLTINDKKYDQIMALVRKLVTRNL